MNFNQKVRLSIIIPIYNSEKYCTCLFAAIKEQLTSETELILIDDGSTDHSLQICYDFFQGVPNVRIIHTDNRGVSKARNVGLDYAQGLYISFIDSDDMIALNYIDTLLRLFDNNPDLVCFNARKIENKKSFLIWDLVDSLYSIDEFIMTPYFWHWAFLNSLWTKVIKREIVKNIYFDINYTLGEDQLFILEYIMNIKTIKTSSENLYIYKYDNNNNSLSKKSNPEVFDYIHKSVTMLSNLVNNYQNPLIHRYYFRFLFNAILMMHSKMLEYGYTNQERIAQFKINISLINYRNKMYDKYFNWKERLALLLCKSQNMSIFEYVITILKLYN